MPCASRKSLSATWEPMGTQLNLSSPASSRQKRPLTSQIDVSTAGMLDLIRVRRIGSIFPLNEPEQSLCGSVGTASPLGAITWWSDVRPTVLVGRDEGQIVGFAEFRPMLPDLRWHLVSVESRTQSPILARLDTDPGPGHPGRRTG